MLACSFLLGILLEASKCYYLLNLVYFVLYYNNNKKYNCSQKALMKFFILSVL
jgi:hypothetical protein